jgi:hypothetical protein
MRYWGDHQGLGKCRGSVARERSCHAWLWPYAWRGTEQKHGPDRLPREVPYKRDPNDLKITGTCKPEGELAILKSGRGMTWRQS